MERASFDDHYGASSSKLHLLEACICSWTELSASSDTVRVLLNSLANLEILKTVNLQIRFTQPVFFSPFGSYSLMPNRRVYYALLSLCARSTKSL